MRYINLYYVIICEYQDSDSCVCMRYIIIVSKLIGFPLSSCSFLFDTSLHLLHVRCIEAIKIETRAASVNRPRLLNERVREACFLFDNLRRCQRGRHLVAKSVRVWEIIIRTGSSWQGRAYTLETGCGYSHCMQLLHSLRTAIFYWQYIL